MDWAAVGAHLARHGITLLPGERPRFSSGFANRNYKVELATGPAVLRRPPPGPLPPGAHDMAREHRILSRLPDALGFVPRSVHLCDDESVIGVKFQLLEFRDGVVIGGGVLPEAFAARGEALSEVMLTTLAAIHAVDPAAVGLGELGRPEGFLARSVEGWLKRGAAVEGGALLEELGVWLRAHAVPDRAPTLLHNDFKLDNIILEPATLRPAAVVDWDQGTRGDPLFDLATLLSYWTEAGDPPVMHELQQMPTAAAGFLGREQAALRWADLTGRDVSDIRFHRVLAIVKLSVIFLQLFALYRRGAATDARFAGFGALGQGVLEFGREVAAGRVF
jgi:aminoglycoside phosphotransferase (APT) family kinase protein